PRAAATKGVDERGGCRIAMSPRVASRALAPDLARSTARKKGRGRRRLGAGRWPRRMGRHKNSLARLWTITCSARRHLPAGGISLKAHKKKRLRPRGEGAPEPPVMRNTDATVYGKEMRRAFTPAAPRYRVHVTAA